MRKTYIQLIYISLSILPPPLLGRRINIVLSLGWRFRGVGFLRLLCRKGRGSTFGFDATVVLPAGIIWVVSTVASKTDFAPALAPLPVTPDQWHPTTVIIGFTGGEPISTLVVIFGVVFTEAMDVAQGFEGLHPAEGLVFLRNDGIKWVFCLMLGDLLLPELFPDTVNEGMVHPEDGVIW